MNLNSASVRLMGGIAAIAAILGTAAIFFPRGSTPLTSIHSEAAASKTSRVTPEVLGYPAKSGAGPVESGKAISISQGGQLRENDGAYFFNSGTYGASLGNMGVRITLPDGLGKPASFFEYSLKEVFVGNEQLL